MSPTSPGLTSPHTESSSRRRSVINGILVAHFVIAWSAFLFRVDLFPLSWAPMYSVREAGGIVDVPEWDRTRRLQAHRRDGGVELLSEAELNIPLLSFWRLYYERAFGRGPNVFHHGNAPMESWCYLVRGLQEGEPRYRANWSRRILESVNSTLGRDEDGPNFIVMLEAEARVAHFVAGSPERWWQTDERAQLRWDERSSAAGGRYE